MQPVASDPVQALATLPLDQLEQIERRWLQNTLAWLKNAPPWARTERLRHLAEGLLRDQSTAEKFQQIWTRGFAPKVYSEAGLPEATSLPQEFVIRVKRRLLPQMQDDLDLYSALDGAPLDEEDADWLAELRDEDVAPWRTLLGASARDLPVAIHLLAIRAAAIALSRDVMKVMPHRYETESPFYNLVDVASGFARTPTPPEAQVEFQETLFQCRISVGLAHVRLEEEGVSSDLVFRLDLLSAQVERMEALLHVMTGKEDARLFASKLVCAFANERSVRSLLRNSLNRVAKQVVTHTGRSGEHNIAALRPEWESMGWGALGAGAITAFTALFKYRFATMALAPLWIGIAHSLNYAVSFVLMQLLGWRLASKMPAMTAAALCSAMEKEDGMQSEVRLVAAITRTQLIVTIGNLLGAIPLSIVIDLLIQWLNGHPFLSQEAALHGIRAMHPWHSLTIPYAALTGCFLWLSSLFGGWTANWMVHNRLPEAIAQSGSVRWPFTLQPAPRLGKFVKNHLSGVAGYGCLGLLLGLLPFVSVFAGIPVEVRHVTLAAASLAYDVSSLARVGALPWSGIVWAVVGLAATGVMNFSVSFALGMWLALRATNLNTRDRKRLIIALWNEFRRQPTRFLWRHEFATAAEDS